MCSPQHHDSTMIDNMLYKTKAKTATKTDVKALIVAALQRNI